MLRLMNCAKNASSIDMGALKEKPIEATEEIKAKAVEAKDAAFSAKEDTVDKLTKLDRTLQSSTTEYNDACTLSSI